MESINSLLFLLFFGLVPIMTGITIVYTALMLNVGVFTWLYLIIWLFGYYEFLRVYIKRDNEKHS
jgi:hypothetical protein